MVLQAYMDESYDDDVFVLAGYVADAEQWAKFSQEWELALANAPHNKRGKRHFKMSTMAMSPARLELVPNFHQIINRNVKMGLSVSLYKKDIARAIARVDNPDYEIDWSDFRNPYYISFRALMDMFHEERKEKADVIGEREVVDFYFDDIAEKKSILRGWDDYVIAKPPEQAAMYGRTPRFEDDDDFLPLQAADFLAWWVRKWKPDGEFGSFTHSSPNKKITHLKMTLDEDDLARIFAEVANIGLLDGQKLIDRKPPATTRIDPPFPLERFFNFLRNLTQKGRQF